jgi:hypothetical protein
LVVAEFLQGHPPGGPEDDHGGTRAGQYQLQYSAHMRACSNHLASPFCKIVSPAPVYM